MKRFHLHVSVQDLDESVRFYSTLFATQPAVRHTDYAKWMLEDPRINFAISTDRQPVGVNHLGFQLDSDAELRGMQAQLEAADAKLIQENAQACCYARGNKYWVTDPTGIAWETFHTLGSIPVYGEDTSVFNHGASTVPTTEAESRTCCLPAKAESDACCEPKVAGGPAVPPEATTAAVTIDAMEERHWDSVRAIYKAGIDTGHATFASSPAASWDAWQRDHLNEFSVVAIEAERVVGWASLAPVSGRCVYSGVAEVSVYVDPAAGGRGVGTQVLAGLIERSEARNVWTLQAGIFPENKASIALHEGLAFEVVGTRRRLGKMTFGPLQGRWRDVLLLERRSSRVGIN